MTTFTDVQFMPAAEKRRVLAAWTRFLKSGCAQGQFTKALYYHLTQHCSFIAHFDRWGFYNVYFETPEGRLKFFTQFDPDGPGRSIEYGTMHWLMGAEYADINQAMREAARPFLGAIRSAATTAARARDLALAHALLAKHGEEVPHATRA